MDRDSKLRALMSSLDGKRVLVTGGTGSFGRAFVHAALTHSDVAKVIVFSRDEQKHYDTALDDLSKAGSQAQRVLAKKLHTTSVRLRGCRDEARRVARQEYHAASVIPRIERHYLELLEGLDD